MKAKVLSFVFARCCHSQQEPIRALELPRRQSQVNNWKLHIPNLPKHFPGLYCLTYCRRGKQAHTLIKSTTGQQKVNQHHGHHMENVAEPRAHRHEPDLSRTNTSFNRRNIPSGIIGNTPQQARESKSSSPGKHATLRVQMNKINKGHVTSCQHVLTTSPHQEALQWEKQLMLALHYTTRQESHV